MPQVDQVDTDALAKMSREELLGLRRRIDGLLALTPSTPTREGDWILDCVIDTLERLGSVRIRWRRAALAPDYARHAPQLSAFLAPTSPSRREQYAVMSLGVELLRDQLNYWRVAATDSAVVRNLDKVPALLDRNFPGYAASGTLAWIVRERSVTVLRSPREEAICSPSTSSPAGAGGCD